MIDPTDPKVLCRLYLNAVLPCLADLTHEDPAARAIGADVDASIVLCVLGGPAVTLHWRHGEIAWAAGFGPKPSVILAFLSDRHLNAFFDGKKWAAPLPLWGGWRVGLLKRFSALAARLEQVMDGAPEVIENADGRRLHARLTLITVGLGLQALAQGDQAVRRILGTLPPGLASFSIAGESKARVWFDHGSPGQQAGWGDPPRRPDVIVQFADIGVAYDVMREQIDTLAAVGAGRIRVDGLVPLADGLNFAMERLRVYLKR